MSTVAPDSAVIFWMTEPPLPMTSRILSGSIFMVSILGAYLLTSGRGAEMQGSMISSRMAKRASRVIFQGLLDDLVGQAVVLQVHLDGGDAGLGASHLEVHLAVEVLHALDVDEGGEAAVVVLDQAQEMPATGALMGTPASMRARVEPQMEPWEVEPLEDSTSETTRMA